MHTHFGTSPGAVGVDGLNILVCTEVTLTYRHQPPGVGAIHQLQSIPQAGGAVKKVICLNMASGVRANDPPAFL